MVAKAAILTFLLVLGSFPWLIGIYAPGQVLLGRFAIGLVLVCSVFLVLDLMYGKLVSGTLGKAVREKTVKSSFSFLRVGYLLFVYAAVSSAVLGVLVLTPGVF